MRDDRERRFGWFLLVATWLVAILGLTALAPAQRNCAAANCGLYGKPCAALLIAHVGDPKLGALRGDFQTWFHANIAQQPALMLLGTQLPTPVQVLGCDLYVLPAVVVAGTTDGSGAWLIFWTIPNDPRLLGLRVDEQFWVWGWTPGKWVATQGAWWKVTQ